MKYTEKGELNYCNGKVCYDKKGAQTARNNQYKKYHAELYIYNCKWCSYWHLTHQKEGIHRSE